MKKTILIVLILLCAHFSYAKLSIITGKIVDDKNKNVPFATVALYSVTQDTSMVKATFTDENGHYKFNGCTEGNYFLEASFVGFSKAKTAIIKSDGKSAISIPSLKLISKAEILKGVEVTAERELIEIKPDKTVFNVQGSINATGNNALELLIKSPGVIIDNEENIFLQGKDGVQVYINNKRSPLRGEDLANFLKNLQSDQIDAIEIITEPSARYDAEGNAGIINIRLVKDKNLGTNAKVNLGFRHGINSKYNGSVSLNNRNKKVNFFGSFNTFDGVNDKEYYGDRHQNGNGFKQNIYLSDDVNTYGFKVGSDFFLSNKTTIGFLVNGNINDNKENIDSDMDIYSLSDNIVDSLLISGTINDGKRNNINYNINFVSNYGEGTSINLDLDYGRFRNTNTSFQPNTYFLPDGETVISENIYSLVTPTDIDIYTAKLDWEGNLFHGKFGIGAKSSFVRTDNTFDYFYFEDDIKFKDKDKSNNFVYDELVNAAYVFYQRKINDNWNIQTGLRMEHTNSKGTLTTANPESDEPPVERDYINWFPSAGITYKLNPKNSFKLNFSRRIDRPNYQNLNPFELKLSELTFKQGNPFLRPQYANSLSLTHTYKSLLNTSLNYTVINDKSAGLVKKLDDNKSIFTFVNLTQQTNLTLTVSYPFSVNKWWNIYATVTGYNIKNEAVIDDIEIDLHRSSFKFYIQNTFTLPKDFKLELSSWYNAPGLYGGNVLLGSQYDISAGISKQLFNKKGNLKISVSDIFLTNPWSTDITFGDLTSQGGGRWESRQLRINFNYNIGSKTVKKARKRKTGIEDLKKRVGH